MKRIIPLVVLVCALAAVLCAASTAAALHPTPDPHPLSLERYRSVIHNQLNWTNRALTNRCRDRVTLDEFTKTPVAAVLPKGRPPHVFYATRRHHKAQGRSSLCLPTTPAGIIRYVFPSYAEDTALRVAGCESTGIPYHLNPYAKNPSSSASGLFQLLDTWWAGKFNPFDPWPNTRTAYALWAGSGGSFARHWAASIGCWG